MKRNQLLLLAGALCLFACNTAEPEESSTTPKNSSSASESIALSSSSLDEVSSSIVPSSALYGAKVDETRWRSCFKGLTNFSVSERVSGSEGEISTCSYISEEAMLSLSGVEIQEGSEEASSSSISVYYGLEGEDWYIYRYDDEAGGYSKKKDEYSAEIFLSLTLATCTVFVDDFSSFELKDGAYYAESILKNAGIMKYYEVTARFHNGDLISLDYDLGKIGGKSITHFSLFDVGSTIVDLPEVVDSSSAL
jgi:hypothetical protein